MTSDYSCRSNYFIRISPGEEVKIRAWFTSKSRYLLFSLKEKSDPLVIPRARPSEVPSSSRECQTSAIPIDYRANRQSSRPGGTRHLISSGLYFGEMQEHHAAVLGTAQGNRFSE